MKKLSLLAAGILLSVGLIAFAAESNDGKKAKDSSKTSCQVTANDKTSCDKSSCDTTSCQVKCCPPFCPPCK